MQRIGYYQKVFLNGRSTVSGEAPDQLKDRVIRVFPNRRLAVTEKVPCTTDLLVWNKFPELLVTISGTVPRVPVLLGWKELPEPQINSLWKTHLVPTGTVRGKDPLSAESIAAFKNQPPGRLWYGEGRLQDGREFLLRPLFPGVSRDGEILCLRRLTREGSS